MDSTSDYDFPAHDRRSGMVSRAEALRPHFSTRQSIDDAEEAIKNLLCQQGCLAFQNENLKRLSNTFVRSHSPHQQLVRSILQKAIEEVNGLENSIHTIQEIFEAATRGWLTFTEDLPTHELSLNVIGGTVGHAFCDHSCSKSGVDEIEEQLQNELQGIGQRRTKFNSLMASASQQMKEEPACKSKSTVTYDLHRRIEASLDRVSRIASEHASLFALG